MASVFLSYAREDTKAVRPLVQALERAGHAVWWDEQVGGGDQFTRAIQDALDNANAVVVVWSKTSVQSAWVRDEAACGRDSGKLLPVSLDGTLPPLGFREYQSIDLSSWSGRTGARQLEALRRAISAKATAIDSQGIAAAPAPVRRPFRWAAAAVIAAVLLVAGLVAAGIVRNPLAAEESTPSLAVLPFADLSPDRDKAYFAEGVAEEISSALAAQRGIKVLGRTSARLIERNADPKTVRSRLGVTHLLEGSARSVGDQLRVNVRLIDTSDGSLLWEEQYKGRPADVFAVQDQIAAAVVQRLRGTLFANAVREAKTTSAAVYQDYLAARALTRTRTRASLTQAMALTKRVVAAAPDYAAGHALLAQLYFQLSDDPTAYGTIPVVSARRLAKPHALRAIRLAPDAPDGYASLGLISKPADAVKPLMRAIELDPSRAEPRVWLGISLSELGRHDEALEQYREAAAVEPLWSVPIHVLIQGLGASGRYEEALNYARLFERRGGSKAQVARLLAHIARFRGDLSGAIAYSRSALALDPNIPYVARQLANDYSVLGLRNEALAVLPSELEFTHALRTGRVEDVFRPENAAKVWTAPDGDMIIHGLGARRDWQGLARLYAAARSDRTTLCDRVQWQGPIFVLALRRAGRTREADQLLECNERRLAFESRMRERATISQHPQVNELEFRWATLLAIKGNTTGCPGLVSQGD